MLERVPRKPYHGKAYEAINTAIEESRDGIKEGVAQLAKEQG
jgi:hypothetical protein